MKKINFRIFLWVFCGFLLGCGDSVGVDYEITKDEKFRDIKRTVEILLSERVDEEGLGKIAEEVYRSGFDRTFIGYRLEGEGKGYYWATTNYDPDLKVSILGSSKEDHENMISVDLKIVGDLIGHWLIDWGGEYKAAIYDRGGKIYMKTLYSDGSGQEKEISMSNVEGVTRYYDEGGRERGEFYIIGPDGHLQFWSGNGNYYTAPKY
ncbi:hypothetical protein RYH70_07045 [Alloalcanivorax xenomutans]|uniref:hypothetical protein n=1 Tax=Alloalcanivorax xenomutans TaxID=1094342 RepID=UPI002934EFAB|nr:hypothetical protein [Alloalcanivorax xenomutans]WOD29824.1 hypothetical protein RYH70_07045 [Alloalcanivorax xenomutans]